MSDLVERYIHQVGQYLPPKERAEIEAELRSQILDKLDDRYDGIPSEAEIAAVLAEWGHPYKIAVSYRSGQYLVSPMYYPYMMMVLWRGWLVIPAIMIFAALFGELVAVQKHDVLPLLMTIVLSTAQALFIFSGIVVLFFALLERYFLRTDMKPEPFDARNLPQVNDPHAVDRTESILGSVFGIFVGLMLVYFAQVGGLTLRFDLNNPGDVIPVPVFWLMVLLVVITMLIVLHLFVLRRHRWNAELWLIETVLELSGIVCLYFVLYQPIFERIRIAVPTLNTLPFVAHVPEIVAILTAASTLITKSGRFLKLWNYRASHTAPYPIQTD